MHNFAIPPLKKFYGFETAQELKDHVIDVNKKLLGGASVALVRDRAPDCQFTLFIIARTPKSEKLYLILPDSKELAFARVRSLRRDIPFVFEVLA